LIETVLLPAFVKLTLVFPSETLFDLVLSFAFAEPDRLTLPASSIVTLTLSFLAFRSFLIVVFEIFSLTCGGFVSLGGVVADAVVRVWSPPGTLPKSVNATAR